MPRSKDPADRLLSPQQSRKLSRQFAHKHEDVVLARQVASATFQRRLILGLTQQGLAEVLGMKQPQVARIESGEVNPSIDTLRRLSERLGLEFTLAVQPAGLTVSYKLPD
jgi:ribosome-binding protein aMBF1 (putative translation factor)